MQVSAPLKRAVERLLVCFPSRQGGTTPPSSLVHSACSKASRTNSVCMELLTRQPTMRRGVHVDHKCHV